MPTRVAFTSLHALIATLLALPTAATAISVADDPFAPHTQQIEARFAVIQAEVDRLTSAGNLAAAASMSAELQQFKSQFYASAPSPLAGPELHLVSVYEFASRSGGTAHLPGTLRVDVSVTDRPVVLALNSYQDVTWDLRLAPGVHLQRILVPAMPQTILNVPPGLTVETLPGFPFFWGYGKDPDHFSLTAQALHTFTGGLTVASVQGTYYGSASHPYSVGPANPDWRAQRVLRESNALYNHAAAFSRAPGLALASSLRITTNVREPIPGTPYSRSRTVHASAAGHVFQTLPSPGASQFAIDPTGPTYYGIYGDSLSFFNPATGAATPIPMTNPNLPPLEWLVGVTFDTTRRRVILASLVGEGYLRSYDPATAHWSHLASLGGVDLGALAYHPADDSLYGIGDGHVTPVRQLFRYSPDGQLLSTVQLDATLVPATGYDDDIQLLDAGQYLVLLRSNVTDFYEPERPPTTWSYVIDPTTGHVLHAAPFIPEPSLLASTTFLPLLLRRRR